MFSSACFLYQLTEKECGSYRVQESYYVVKEIARGISRITSCPEYHLSGAGKIEKYDLLADLVNSWTPKASGIAWWGLEEDTKIFQHLAQSFGKEKEPQ